MRRVFLSKAARLTSLALALALPLGFVAGCGDDDVWKPPPGPPPGAAGAPGAAADGGVEGAAVATTETPLPQRQFNEGDFTETDKNRDPFRGYATMFAAQAKGRVVVQRQVVIDRFSLDELKLSGIVTRTQPSALFVDPASVGWIVKVGDYVGKAEIVHTGGPSGVDIAINWRVDRIRQGDVVFVREDPAHPEIAPVTRVIALFPTEGENQKTGLP